MQTFKSITGGDHNTPEEVFAKFPWLKEASFEDAEVDISHETLIWKNGTWEDGYWEYGIWENGTWKDGHMWSNIDQRMMSIESWDSEKKMFITEK